MKSFLLGVVGLLLLALTSAAFAQASENEETTKTGKAKTVRVFILAGQSNMAGHGVVDLDDPKDYNGGKGTLVQVMNTPKNKARFAHIKNEDGTWKTRDDVFVWHQTSGEYDESSAENKGLKKGGLTIGFTGYEGAPHHIGPEFQFGHVVGDAFDEPVLLIKTSWGGKSLLKDFLPPSSAIEKSEVVGPYYIKMLEEIGAAMLHAGTEIPALKDHEFVISGFVWQQGWNDMINDEATAEYETNLKNLIKDIRKQFGTEDLPIVIGELGNGGVKANSKMKKFRAAQSKAGTYTRDVAFVPTAAFARPAKESPNQGHLHHWFGNAESYFLVGDALGKSMVSLINDKEKARVLILGDSISIGYTPFVRQQLASTAQVFRPTILGKRPENCAGTDAGIKNIDRWLTIAGGDFDVIHVNFGLHDMKHVDPGNGKGSNDPKHPLQSAPEEYEKQLHEIVAKLKETKSKIILCTTTPVPPGCKPRRATTSPGIYNEIMKKVAAENEIEVNDLFEFANPQLSKIQQPANVHFSRDGSKILATKVAEVIEKSLK
ncbi:MAG: sialate O-acetylesterase [Mariniblastus sp.]